MKTINLCLDHRDAKREEQILVRRKLADVKSRWNFRNGIRYRKGRTSQFRDLIKLQETVNQYISAALGDGVTC